MADHMFKGHLMDDHDPSTDDEVQIPRFVDDPSFDVSDYECVVKPRHLVKPPVKQLECGDRICGDCLSDIVQNGEKTNCPGQQDICAEMDLTDARNIHDDNGAELDLADVPVNCTNGCKVDFKYSEIQDHLAVCRPGVELHQEVPILAITDGMNEIDITCGNDACNTGNISNQQADLPEASTSYRPMSNHRTSQDAFQSTKRSNPGNKDGYRVLLLGATGCGKSSVGNNLLLKRKEFLVSGQVAAVTTQVTVGYTERETDGMLTVVDTPGLTSTDSLKSNSLQEILGAIKHSEEGYDAFLFVLKYPTRFAEEEKKCMDNLKHILGEDFTKYTVLIFTGGDTYKNEMKLSNKANDFQSYIDSNFLSNSKDSLGSILRQNNGAYILIDSFEENITLQQMKRNELLNLVNGIKERNGRRYTKEMLPPRPKEFFQGPKRKYTRTQNMNKQNSAIKYVNNSSNHVRKYYQIHHNHNHHSYHINVQPTVQVPVPVYPHVYQLGHMLQVQQLQQWIFNQGVVYPSLHGYRPCNNL